MAQQDLAELRYASTEHRAASVDAMLVAASGRHQTGARPERVRRLSLRSLTQRSGTSAPIGGTGIIRGLEFAEPTHGAGPTEGQVRAMIVGVLLAAWVATQLLAWAQDSAL